MADNITVVDVEMEPSKVVAIVDRWASENEFSVHERTGKRVLFRYDRHIASASWLSVENLGAKARLSAWLAPKGLDPDAKGSFWKGNKVAIPVGFATGPLRRFKKQFNKLVEMIKRESNDPSVIPATQNEIPVRFSKDGFAKGTMVFAVIVLLNGVLGIFNSISLANAQILPGLDITFVRDGVVNLVYGALLFFCARLLKNGKALSIWLYGATIVFSVGQDLARGSKFPFLTVLFGVWITSQLLGLKKQGQLA